MISMDVEDDDVRTWESSHLGISSQSKTEEDQFLRNLLINYYSPFLLNRFLRVAILFLFCAGFFVSVYLASQVTLGFDEKILINDHSYLVSYEKAKSEYLTIGPPIYVVIQEGYDYSAVDYQNMICANPGCSLDSLVNQFSSAPYILPGLHSWLDDYLIWAQSKECCTQVNGAYCFNSTGNSSIWASQDLISVLLIRAKLHTLL